MEVWITVITNEIVQLNRLYLSMPNQRWKTAMRHCDVFQANDLNWRSYPIGMLHKQNLILPTKRS